MVSDFIVVCVLCLCNICMEFFRQDMVRKALCRRISFEFVQIFVDLFCDGCRQYSCVRSRICRELFFIQVLRDLQRLIRADLEAFGALSLQFRQIEEQGRLFPGDAFFQRLYDRLFSLKGSDQFLRVFLFLESVFFVELRGAETGRTFDCLPLRLDPRLGKIPDNPVKRGLFEVADLAFPVDHHAEHTGHDPAHGDRGVALCRRGVIEEFSVFDGHDAREVDAHGVVLDRAHDAGSAEVFVCRHRFCLRHAALDLLLGLRVDPHAHLLHSLAHTAEIADIFLDGLPFRSRPPSTQCRYPRAEAAHERCRTVV